MAKSPWQRAGVELAVEVRSANDGGPTDQRQIDREPEVIDKDLERAASV